MKTFTLNIDGTHALKFIDGENTGEWCNVSNNREYLEWVDQGNAPDPYVEPERPELTPQQKLEAAGLTVEELKTLLGLK